MAIFDTIRTKVRNFLQITENTTVTGIIIYQGTTHEVECAINDIIYRADAYEIEQMFKNLAVTSGARFWTSTPSKGLSIRKIHTGVPALIIDTHANILVSSLNTPVFEDASDAEVFAETFSEDNNQDFRELIKQADTQVLIEGDGAFKCSWDTALSDCPFWEFYPASKIEVKRTHGIITEIVFYTDICENRKKYTLKETYGKGYIVNELYRDNNKVDLTATTATAGLEERVEFGGNYVAAVYVKYWDSPKFPGRGKPLLAGKLDNIDALDEIVSQWQDAVRAGRVQKYIPEQLIPRDSNGHLVRPNPYDNQFISVRSSGGEGNDKITVVQPSISYEAFEASYVAALDRLLLGVISPSTLGIDARKLDDNATAQREREKVTGWIRIQRVDKLKYVIKQLINITLKTYANIHELQGYDDYSVEITFDEFNSPNLEETIEVLSKACPGKSIISTRTATEIIAHALNKDDEWIDAEEQRIKEESGLMITDEPALGRSDFDF